jgi:hypothetical protein
MAAKLNLMKAVTTKLNFKARISSEHTEKMQAKMTTQKEMLCVPQAKIVCSSPLLKKKFIMADCFTSYVLHLIKKRIRIFITLHTNECCYCSQIPHFNSSI